MPKTLLIIDEEPGYPIMIQFEFSAHLENYCVGWKTRSAPTESVWTKVTGLYLRYRDSKLGG